MGPKTSPALMEEYGKKAADYGKKIAKYETEKADIQKEAKKHEQIRDESKKHSEAFGIAVIFLQIAILLSSIAALIKKKYIWGIGLVVGSVGIVYFINGFLLFL